MKKYLFRASLASILTLFTIGMQAQETTTLAAFPGAEGFGKYATGGRTGTVYHVTNLNDSGTGSLRDAVSQPNRIVVFDVGGVIKISKVLTFSANLYIAGQTAPGEGIVVYGNRVTFSGATNTICRYMKFRMGSITGDSGKDACGVANGTDIIFDHCSISWGRDETFSINDDNKGVKIKNITIQNSIVSQGLMSHSAGGLIQTSAGGVTLYRNLYADNDTRNNKIKGINQYVNNIVYNWNSGAYIMGGDSEGESYANCVSNYFIKGPDGGNTPMGGANALFHVYADDNWFDNNKNGVLDGYLVPHSEYGGTPDFETVPYDYPALPTTASSQLVDESLPTVGASLPCRDYVDYYIVNEVKTLGTAGAIITCENQLPFGEPSKWSLWSGNTRLDTDKDGMPDEWETANNLNPLDGSDAMLIASNQYTNIENYINGITRSYTQHYLRVPLNLTHTASTKTSITLSWLDYTDNEDGFIIERKIGDTFKEIGRTSANIKTYTVENLTPAEAGTYRVQAFDATIKSYYSNSVTCKSDPTIIDPIDLTTYTPDMTWVGNSNKNWDKTSSNWISSATPSVFTDNSKTMFPTLAADETIVLTENVAPKDIVVDSENDYTISGTALITGATSLNKTGSGKLSLLSANTYTGPTVIYNGTMEINSLANGGEPCSIGASQNYGFNWVWSGGKIEYTGASISTDRCITLNKITEFSINQATSTITLNGTITGESGFTKAGDGKLYIIKANNYSGATTISKGTIELNGLTAINGGLGTSNIVNLSGGSLVTTGGDAANYEDYNFTLNVAEGTINGLSLDRTCYFKSKVTGQGTLNFNIPYVREYIQGDWSEFTGTLNANSIGTTTDGNQLLINNPAGIPNGRVVTSGNTKIVSWANAQTLKLGGLSGSAGTTLAGGNKGANGSTCTWIVGGANTDETFNGIINNECSNKSYKGTTTIIKEGSGLWRLTGNNIYAGTTTVKGGKLIINGTHTSTAKTAVENGATLAGTGTIPAPVEIQTGATLEPGDETIGTLNVGNLVLSDGSNTAIEINKTKATNDKVAATTSVVIGGTLTLTITGTLEIGDKFTLFTGTINTGSFSQISPATPGDGLSWAYNNGVLSVIKSDNTPLDEKPNSSSVTLFPNPVYETLYINLSANSGVTDISITDITGNVLKHQQHQDQQNIKLDLSSLTDGIYFVRVDADKKTMLIEKIIKK